mmetsp:Transcript_44691/g.80360  ORF Transcript_44691/g.80360 Transcript_44691/m.80360 type:complete len:94 (+) Transcript_44691:222-503(+)
MGGLQKEYNVLGRFSDLPDSLREDLSNCFAWGSGAFEEDVLSSHRRVSGSALHRVGFHGPCALLWKRSFCKHRGALSLTRTKWRKFHRRHVQE